MSEKYKNKYRIKSNRMPNWDYSNNGYYFITIVTQNRECNLGEIVNVPTIVETHGEIVETHGTIVQTHGTIVQTHGTIVQTHGTIVQTHGRASLQSASVQLSSFGKIVENEWNKSFEIRD